MGYSQHPTITDELLSAYIDNAVSDAERAVVEAAIANDLDIAWRVESLRSTVSILAQLADVPLPRSFTLNDALLEMVPAGETTRPATRPRSPDSSDSFWEKWLGFWRSGSMAWRNAAAVCAVLLMVFFVGDFVLLNEASLTRNEMATIAPVKTVESSTFAVEESQAAPAAVAMVSESAAQAEEQAVPKSTAAPVQGDGESVEAETVLPAALAMNREPETLEETVLLEEGATDDESSSGIAVDAAGTDVTETDVAAAEKAGDVSTESTLRLAPAVEAGDEVAEPAAGLMVAASPLGDSDILAADDSTPVESAAEIAPPTEADEPLTAASIDVGSAGAEPVVDAASPVEAVTQPQILTLTDDAAIADAQADVGTDLPEAESAGTESAAFASAEVVGASQAAADEPKVSEPVPEELVVQGTPQADGQSEAVQPATIAMADSADQIESDGSDRTAPELAETPMEEGASNSGRLFGIAQIVLAILALTFFVLWLRSRSQPAAVSPQN